MLASDDSHPLFLNRRCPPAVLACSHRRPPLFFPLGRPPLSPFSFRKFLIYLSHASSSSSPKFFILFVSDRNLLHPRTALFFLHSIPFSSQELCLRVLSLNSTGSLSYLGFYTLSFFFLPYLCSRRWLVLS